MNTPAAKGLSLLFLVISFLSVTVTAQVTATWNGSVNNSWNTPGNWTWTGGSGVPAATTDVVVTDNVTHPLVLANGVTALCNNITLQSATGNTFLLLMEENSYLHIYGNVSNGTSLYPSGIMASDEQISQFYDQSGISFLGAAPQQITGVTLGAGKIKIDKTGGDVQLNELSMLYVADSLIFSNAAAAIGAATSGNLVVNTGALIINSQAAHIGLPVFNNTQVPPHIITGMAPDYNNMTGILALANPVNFSGITTAATLPVGGNAYSYTPVTLEQTGSGTNAWGVYVRPDLYPACANNELNTLNFVQRAWEITPLDPEELSATSAGSGVHISLTFNSNNTGQDIGNAFNPDDKPLKILRHNGSCYSYLTGNIQTGTSGYITITRSNQLQFPRFVIAPDTNQVPVTSVDVTVLGDTSTTISVNGGTKQLQAIVLPDTADQLVTWSIVALTGSATINPSGLVTAQSNGTVYAKAVSEADATKSDSILLTISNQVTGIPALAAGYGFTLFPNPAHDAVWVTLKKTHPPLTVTVTDLQGRILLKETKPAGSLPSPWKIDMQKLLPGLYLFHFTSDDVQWSSKVAKQ